MANNNEYSSHREQVASAQPPEGRSTELEQGLLDAFRGHIEYRSTAYILLGDISVEELAEAFLNYPQILKPLCAGVNVATRAIKRDLDFDLNLYHPRLTSKTAGILAGYLKPLFPSEFAVPALIELDRFFWVDKEVRAAKGNWEKRILAHINKAAAEAYKKRKFELGGESFEIDAAWPSDGVDIKVAIDVKRIEAKRDTHKRADEVVNKAAKFKRAYPRSAFYSIIYYPFPDQHQNLRSRLSSADIDGVFFAAETDSSIESAVHFLLAREQQLVDASGE